MKKYNLLPAILSILVLVNSSTVFANFKCPIDTGYPVPTANNDGKASYHNKLIAQLYSILIKNSFSKSDPILDVMAGYGAELNALLSEGASNIYVNEVNQDNLKCMKQFNFTLSSKPNVMVKYIPGDITDKKVLDQLPNNHFKIVFVINGIQFLSFMDFKEFSKAMYKKMANNSIIILVYENPYLKQQNKMIKEIVDQFYAGSQTIKQLDDIVKNVYESYSLPRLVNKKCSYQAYQDIKSKKDKVYILGACQLVSFTQKGYVTLYTPKTVSLVMESAGFSSKIVKKLNDKSGSVVMTFVKS